MRKKSISSQIVYFFNSVFAILLLLSYALPFISPKSIPAVAVISLLVPLIVIINLFFTIYWLLKLKRKVFLSLSLLIFGVFISSPYYKFKGKNNAKNNDLTVMSYNVRTFNYFKWDTDNDLDQKIFGFINDKDPDIVCIQEYYDDAAAVKNYPYTYIKKKNNKGLFGMAILSKYKIINQGSFNFEESINNAIYADVLFGNDTVRIYNLHLESLKIKPNEAVFGAENKEQLFKRVSSAFKKQTFQAEEVLQHQQDYKGKQITCGDFNNTSYSWVYRQLSKDKKDAFLEAGEGFGKSFNYFFPFRIDYILTDKTATVNQFNTFSVKYSDHFPILARINWKKELN